MKTDLFLVVPLSFLNALVKEHEKHEHDEPCGHCNAVATLKDINKVSASMKRVIEVGNN